jgi:transcription initiation factor TFIIIB Brf1 subunit/transcription initiation factor TFIIB
MISEDKWYKSFSLGAVSKDKEVTITCNGIARTFDLPQTNEEKARFISELQQKLGLTPEQAQKVIKEIATKVCIQQNIFSKTIKELAEELKISLEEVEEKTRTEGVIDKNEQ